MYILGKNIFPGVYKAAGHHPWLSQVESFNLKRFFAVCLDVLIKSMAAPLKQPGFCQY